MLPTRSQVLFVSLVYAGLGGASFGVAEGAREVVRGQLYLSTPQTLVLLCLGALTGALLGLVGGLVVGVLPRRPLGRTRWSAFLAGLAVLVVAATAVVWFTDPPPFTDPFPLQGNPVVFAGIVTIVALVGLVLYQGARGAGRVTGVALAMLAALGVWLGAAGRGIGQATYALPAGAPNVLLVTFDTARADRFGAYGNPDVDTRHFDALAREGALFRNASAVAAVTGPSHTSMLTGSGPWDHGVLLNGIPVPEDRPLLAEILHDHGWRTAAFVSSYVLEGEKGFERGFEVYDDDFGTIKGSSALVAWRLVAMVQRHLDPDAELERRGGDTVDAALHWIRDSRGAWFAWVHLFDPHGPYEPPPPFDTMYYQGDRSDPNNTSMKDVTNVAAYLRESLQGVTDLRYVLAQYDGEISYTDAQLGRLLAAVDARNTLVMVIADHGELLGEHGVWFNHGDDVYETSVHVPAAIRWPGRVTAGPVDKPFEGSDVAPTLLEIVGVERPATMTGVSAAPLVGFGEGSGRIEARSLCFDREANVAARERGEIEKPKWKMAGVRGQFSRYVQRETDRDPEYFDLVAEPAGLTDIYPQLHATLEGQALFPLLRRSADSILSGTAADRSTVELSEEENAMLEALGYIDPTGG